MSYSAQKNARTIVLVVGLSCGMLTMAAASRAEALERADPLVLHWDEQPGCPSTDAVRERVDRHLASAAEQSASSPVTAHASLRRERTGAWSADLTLETIAGTHHRALGNAQTCDAIADAVALILALSINPTITIDPPASDDAGERTPRAEETPTSASVSAPVPPTSALPHRSDPRSIAAPRGAVGVAGALEVGAFPRPAGRIEGDVAALWRRARIGVLGQHTFEQRLSVAPGQGVTLALWSLGAYGCFLQEFGLRHRLALPVCAGANVGQLRAAPIGLVAGRTARDLWVDVTLRSGATFAPHRSVALGLFAEGYAPLVRPRYRIEELGGVHRPSAVGLRVGAKAEFRFR
jgi:hypothetical protein